MRRGREWLSTGAEALAAASEQAADQGRVPRPVDLLVVGSGYGGAVAAARMAESPWGAGRRIVLLERGREWLPGDFPDRFEAAVPEIRFTTRAQREPRGRRDALYDVRVGLRQSVLVANGLGGGSLINAGVAEPADARTLSDPTWPAPWRGDLERWNVLYERARTALGARAWMPQNTPRDMAMRSLAWRLGRSARPVTLTIEPAAGGDAGALPPRSACASCGDCFSGCNLGAKRTLGTSYLVRARRAGVEIHTGASVLELSRRTDGDGWDVHWVHTDPKRRPVGRPDEVLHARRVVLAAGTLGSTEILLRSRAAGLALSPRLGRGFSGNGDVIGAQAGLHGSARSWADEADDPAARTLDPTITRQIEIQRDHPDPARRHVVQNLLAPGPLGWVYGELITSLSLPHRWLRWDLSTRHPGTPDPACVDRAAGGLLDRTLLLAVFGHDGAGGRLRRLHRGRHVDDGEGFVVADAPTKRDAAARQRWWATHVDADRLLKRATPSASDWLRQPLWQAAPDAPPLIDPPQDHATVSVHPLGGCAMGTTRTQGVVDAEGRVFDAGADDDRAVHPGLYVLDGSIVPGSLGINPLLTITALAEGITDAWQAQWLAADRRLDVPHPPAALPPWPVGPRPPRAPAAATQLRFAERMTGVLANSLQDGPPDADSRLRLSLRFVFDEVDDAAAFAARPGKALGLQAFVDVLRSTWDPQTRGQRDGRTEACLPLDAPLVGTVWWMEQQRSCVLGRWWRAFQAWRDLRRAADLPRIDKRGRPKPHWFIETLKCPASLPELVRKFWMFVRALSHFGAPRLLKYRLQLPDGQSLQVGGAVLPGGTWLEGEKSFVYTAGGNPWRQLTQMPLRARLPDGRVLPLCTLRYDELFMIGRDELPLRLEGGGDALLQLRDAGSVLLFVARVFLLQHFPSLRVPDYSPARVLDRLPRAPGPQDEAYLGVQFSRIAFDPPDDEPERPIDPSRGRPGLMLSRFRRDGVGGVPVLLVHGLGSGGVQFTHPGLPAPLAAGLAQAGLDVWVGELRTSIGLPRHAQSWSMDDVARHDLPALVRRVLVETGQPQLDVVAHCIGSAMTWMALLSGELRDAGGAASLVRRFVAMQVGPIVHLPRGNRVRGYVGNRLQSLLRLKSVASTIDDRARDGDRAIDRVLGSAPFIGDQDEDWHERGPDPQVRLTDNLQHNGWLANAHRSAGIFAQLFHWRNLRRGQLALLGDLLGRVNLQTYEQTVQYTLLRRLTNANAEAVYVTERHLREHVTMPVLFVQGELNDVFAPRGTLDSAAYLRRVRGPGGFIGRLLVQGYGHLDCVVGDAVGTRILPPIVAFLQAPDGDAAIEAEVRARVVEHVALECPALAEAGELALRMPSIGPWLGHAERGADGRSTVLRIGIKLDERRPVPPAVATMLFAGGRALPATARFWWVAGFPVLSWPLVEAWDDEGEAVIELAVDDDTWLQLDDSAELEVGVVAPDWLHGEAHVAASREGLGAELVAAWERLRTRFSRTAAAERPSRDDAEQTVDALKLSVRWLRGLRSPQLPWAFAIGACRQAPLLADRHRADAAWGRLCEQRDRLGLVLLLGDQIYADALSIASSSMDTRLRYFEAYREAWTAPQQRDAMRSLPHAMTADDHEFRDDYRIEDYRTGAGTDRRLAWRDAREPMWRYQFRPGVAGQRRSQDGPARRWYGFDTAQARFFVADTRSERRDGARIDRADAEMIGDAQRQAIEDWLGQAACDDRPSFLALPSPVAPVFGDQGVAEHPLRSDGWQRHPQTLGWLLGAIRTHRPRQLVLLSGDYHCFADVEIELQDPAGGDPIRCVQFVTGGLYSPYGFANTALDELAWPGPNGWWTSGGVNWRYRLRPGGAGLVTGSGFGRVEIDADRQVRLVVETV